MRVVSHSWVEQDACVLMNSSAVFSLCCSLSFLYKSVYKHRFNMWHLLLNLADFQIECREVLLLVFSGLKLEVIIKNTWKSFELIDFITQCNIKPQRIKCSTSLVWISETYCCLCKPTFLCWIGITKKLQIKDQLFSMKKLIVPYWI